MLKFLILFLFVVDQYDALCISLETTITYKRSFGNTEYNEYMMIINKRFMR